MILVRVLPATKEVVMLSIPRDLYVHLSTGGSGKIGGAYSYLSAGAAVAPLAPGFWLRGGELLSVGRPRPLEGVDADRGLRLGYPQTQPRELDPRAP